MDITIPSTGSGYIEITGQKRGEYARTLFGLVNALIELSQDVPMHVIQLKDAFQTGLSISGHQFEALKTTTVHGTHVSLELRCNGGLVLFSATTDVSGKYGNDIVYQF